MKLSIFDSLSHSLSLSVGVVSSDLLQNPKSQINTTSMAKKQQKRPSPLPDPSSSSSSDSEEQHQPPSATEDEEEQQVQVSSSEEEEEEEEQQPESDSDSDSDQPPLSHRPAAKRAAENNADAERVNNKKNKAVVDAGGGDSDAKKRFLRVWSVEDETAILKGLAEFISKTGKDPLKHGDAFYNFMKNSLQLDSNTKHLMQKVRRLKYKFHTHVAKGYNGDGPKFPKVHFDLCKNIWGSSTEPKSKSKSKSKSESKFKSTEAAEENPNTNGNAVNVPPSSAKKSKSDKQVVDTNVEASVEASLLLRSEMFGYGNMNEDVVKKGLELIGASKRAELEVRWSKLQVAELELVAKRAQLIYDQSRIILEAYKSSNNYD
ncbi:STOREKEEPER protein-like [Lotus japonicus]|uniref:STOREKEEPER protein-like n=1 Tax=Lotus japonicus TaxID=34305 RepID=UPI00258C6C87|nr:STOREKEEPER protein-like [Lotus japonicus]